MIPNHSRFAHAQVGGREVIDLTQMDRREFAFAQECLQHLLAEDSFQIEVNSQSAAVDTLRHLYFSSKNALSRTGRHPLCIAYPLLKVHPAEQSAAPYVFPLFFWRVRLEPSPNRLDNWILKANANTPVFPNPLLHHIVDLLPSNPALAELLASYPSYEVSARSQINQLSGYAELDVAHLQNWQTSSQVNDIPWSLHNVAVCGLFEKSTSEKIVPARKPDLQPPTPLRYSLSPVPATAAMQATLHAVNANCLTLVKGPANSDHAAIAAMLVSLALVNEKKCLVIGSEVDSLQRIQNAIQQQGVGELSILLKDEHTDLPQLQEALQRQVENAKLNTAPDDALFNDRMEAALRAYKPIQQAANLLHTDLYEDEAEIYWSEAVAAYLSSVDKEGKEWLNSQLTVADFVNDHHAYRETIKVIGICQSLYPKIGTLRHPLQSLHARWFDGTELSDTQSQLQHLLQAQIDKTSVLQRRLIGLMAVYGDKLRSRHHAQFHELLAEAQKLQANYARHRATFGPAFDKPIGWTQQLAQVFSSGVKERTQALQTWLQEWDNFMQKLRQTSDFEYVPKQDHLDKPEQINQELKNIEEALRKWHQDMPAQVSSALNSLNLKNAHREVSMTEEIEEMVYDIDVRIHELNEAKLYKDLYHNRMHTLATGQQQLEKIIDDLELTQYHMRDFENFFPWQTQWLTLSFANKKKVQALTRVKPADWQAAYQSWYMDQLLSKLPHAALPQSMTIFENYEKAVSAVREHLPNYLRQQWHHVFDTALRNAKRDERKYFSQLVRKTTARGDIAHIWQYLSQQVSNAFPAILLTETLAVDLLNTAPEGTFGLVLLVNGDAPLDNARLSLLSHSERCVVFSHLSQHTSQAEGYSLADYVTLQGAAEVHNRLLQSPIPPALLAYQQAYHYMEPMTVPTNRIAEGGFSELAVGGRYDVVEKTNTVEADEIIRYLNQVDRRADQTYPKVVIACATIEQRNLIADNLLKIKQRRAEGSERIRQLERNGLRVLHFSELEGVESDLRILSLVYGPEDRSAVMTDDLQALQTPDGQYAWHLACTQPCQSMIWVHSVPILRAASDESLPSFLSDLLSSIRNQLQLAYTHKEDSSSADAFSRAIAQRISAYIGKDRIQWATAQAEKISTLRIAPLQEGGRGLAIIPDMALSKQAIAAPEATRQEMELLSQAGYLPLVVWSVKWWKNPRQEARKLAATIIRYDEQLPAV